MIINILTYLTILLGLIVIPLSIYQFIIGLHYFKKTEKIKEADKINKFAILIAARNEATVIKSLIQSLDKLNYPKDKYDIIVAPNNCSDNTKGAAIESGARIFEVQNPVKNKGDVLHQLFEYLTENEDHDAYVIFDADNIVDQEFLNEMNKQIESGFGAAQGFRDSINPYESFTSGAYTLYHYMINMFYNKPRTILKLNNMIVGCGFMVTRDVINSLGGWNTKTMTEDLEFTVLTTLEGYRIGYSEKAIFYDEQPNSFITSWHQRIRWQTGVRQGFKQSSAQLINNIVKDKEIKYFDTLSMLSANFVSNVNLLSMLVATTLITLKTTSTLGLTFLGLNILGTITAPILFAILILVLSKRKIFPMWKGILFFGIFLASWIPINLYVLFNKKLEWKQIERTSKVRERI